MDIGTTSLFRPVPANSVQQNLAGFYGKTHEFVQEKFDGIREQVGSELGRRSNPVSEVGIDDSPSAIRPLGVGELLDVFV